MVATADRYGRVWGSVPGLARRANVTLDEAQAALKSFKSPDPYSRTPDHEGRRIEDIDGGWCLLNYPKYRALKDLDHQRAQAAERKARQRGKQDRDSHATSVTERDSHGESRMSRQGEGEGEGEKNNYGEAVSPEMVALSVMEDLQVSGRELKAVLDDVCRMSMKAGTSADDLRDSLVSAWRAYEEAKPKLSYAWGAKTFFGEGHWRNKSGWPKKEGQTLTARVYVNGGAE